jgi:hypothetical protein
LFAAHLTGCLRNDAKAEEKRLHLEIQRLAEDSRSYINSDEVREALVRLNELRRSFPEKRDAINTEARSVKAVFTRMIEDDDQMIALWRKLLELPLSATYRDCVSTAIGIQELTSAQSRNIIDEMDVLMDPSMIDRDTLDAKLAPILRKKEETSQRSAERERQLEASGCRGPQSPVESQ